MSIFILNSIIIIIYMLLVFFIFPKNEKIKKIIYILAVTQIILILGLRDLENVGKDWSYYSDFFDLQLTWNITDFFDTSIYMFGRFEIGFKIFTKFISCFTTNKQIYALSLSVISIVPISYVIYKHSAFPLFSIFFYCCFNFYFFDFSGLRQGVAISFIFLSYHHLCESNFKNYLLCIVIATLFHYSAILFLPVYFLKKLKLNPTKIIVMTVIFCFVFIIRIPLFNFITKYFYDDYTLTYSNSYLWAIFCIFIYIVCLFISGKSTKSKYFKDITYIIVFIGCLCFIFSGIMSDVLRLANIFYIFIILLVPNIIDSFQSKNNKIIIYGVSIGILLAVMIYLLNVDDFDINPYCFFARTICYIK